MKNKVETVKILYHLPHYVPNEERITKESVLMKAEMINDSKLVNVCINILENAENPMDKVHSNPNYNFIILHLSEQARLRQHIYQTTDLLRQEGSNAILVAESSIYPCGKEEILEHFDEYSDRIAHGHVLEDLLKKYGFMKREQ